ncbi:odorant receptor 131-2-like [Lissotriton helveticus]
MDTSVSLPYNATQRIFTTPDINTWITLTITLLLFLSFFLFFILLMLYVFFTTARLRQQTRYILFVYTLATDTGNFTTCVLLFFLSFAVYRIPAGECYFVIIIATSTFYSSRNSLAAMALERYVAICFPLRHPVICRVERSWVIIMAISAFGFLPPFIDLMILSSLAPHNFFFQRLICQRDNLTLIPQQKIAMFASGSVIFAVVALIILYTYINIMLEAKKISGNKESSSKASKTVMLHAVQLLLSLTYFSATFSENPLQGNVYYVRFLNFFIFMLLPVFLSPLIYGLRDENFRIHIQTFFTCRPHRANSGGQQP